MTTDPTDDLDVREGESVEDALRRHLRGALARSEQGRRMTALAKILLDLDRCVHGRHEGDVCHGCSGSVSAGNPNMRPGQVIGYGLDGELIVMPDREHKNDPGAWRGRRTP